ncbi:MAG TPA: 1-deoxy-D-xylulose-5-phosphate reductoisomerase [Nocardioidaceae bacterium]|nr:1-deoxy-D-xylulose-5-phosphate reductoisomerase [Nocardioidaceae bacterium]
MSVTARGPKEVVVLGSTGSIGTQALDLIDRCPDRFRVVALAAGGSNPALLAEQAVAHQVPVVAVAAGTSAEDVQLALFAAAQRQGYSSGDFKLPRVLVGPKAAQQVAALPCDVVLNAMTGAVGLQPTLAALEAGRTLALANKESLIIGGDLVKRVAKPGQLIPVDSEHSALAQCLRGGAPEEVRRLVVTASGGPFRGRGRDELAEVTPEQALNHPTWSMGPVITINSATLVNKGLEVIEAHLLFDIDFDRIDVVVHPQSIVHSMVEFVDGSTLAQAAPPNMGLAISLALGWPDLVPDAVPGCDWTKASTWEFFPLDHEAFPAVRLAAEAGRAAGTAPAVFNAANEVCVEAFRAGQLPFTAIVDTVASVLGVHDVPSKASTLTLDDVLAADEWARTCARRMIGQQSTPQSTQQQPEKGPTR